MVNEKSLQHRFSTAQTNIIIRPLLNNSVAVKRIRVGASATFLAMKKAGVFNNENNRLRLKEVGLIYD